VTPKVIFDSNFFFIPTQFKIDIFEEMAKLLNQKYEQLLLSTTLFELRGIAEKGTPKLRRQAQTALNLTRKCKLVNAERKEGETNDDVVVRMAMQLKCAVATNDSVLRRRLRDISIPVIYLRQKSRLELEGSL
jgi:hypothetical protein